MNGRCLGSFEWSEINQPQLRIIWTSENSMIICDHMRKLNKSARLLPHVGNGSRTLPWLGSESLPEAKANSTVEFQKKEEDLLLHNRTICLQYIDFSFPFRWFLRCNENQGAQTSGICNFLKLFLFFSALFSGDVTKLHNFIPWHLSLILAPQKSTITIITSFPDAPILLRTLSFFLIHPLSLLCESINIVSYSSSVIAIPQQMKTFASSFASNIYVISPTLHCLDVRQIARQQIGAKNYWIFHVVHLLSCSEHQNPTPLWNIELSSWIPLAGRIV